MNTIITSEADILAAAKQIALTEGMSKLNMRSLADRCRIAVGSIYNYYPTKTDLTVAVVGEIWKEILHPALFIPCKNSFVELVEALAQSIQNGVSAYPAFFSEHAAVILEKEKGRTAMELCFFHIRAALTEALDKDPNISDSVWDDAFTKENFAAFVLDFLRAKLLCGPGQAAFLKALILRTVYKAGTNEKD